MYWFVLSSFHITLTVPVFHFSVLVTSCRVRFSLHRILLTVLWSPVLLRLSSSHIPTVDLLLFSQFLISLSQSVLSCSIPVTYTVLLTCPPIPYSLVFSFPLHSPNSSPHPHSSNYHIPTRSESNKTIDTDDVWVEWYASGVKERRRGRELV